MGLTGKQGVMIPKSNVGDLALYSEVVRRGQRRESSTSGR